MKVYIYCLIILIFTGCTHPEVWERAGGNQQLFDLDSRECEIIAQQISLRHSETGKSVDPTFFSEEYIKCLGAKGWSKKVVVPESVSIPKDKQLAKLIDLKSVKGFEQTITVPDTHTLLLDKQFQSGPTIIKQFFWKGEDTSFINILFQENITTTFEHNPYPVMDPYQIYTSGEGEKSQERLQWTTFWGHIDSDWVMGTGAYYYVSKSKRIIIVITRPLAHPSGTAPKNVTLSRNQFIEIEQFSDQWQLWLNQQFQQGPGLIKQIMQALRLGRKELLTDM